MAIISPISDLHNYNTILEKVSVGSPVYLTVNGRGKVFEASQDYQRTNRIHFVSYDLVNRTLLSFIFIVYYTHRSRKDRESCLLEENGNFLP